jgi:hypothetical protein
MGSLIACLSECQLELPPSRRHFSGLSFERLDRSVDAEWPQDAQNLGGDSLIRSEATEGDAPLGASSSGQTCCSPRTAFGRNGHT